MKELAGFHRQFQTPPHLNTEELQRERFKLLSEEMNKIIRNEANNDEVASLISDACTYVLTHHRSTHWPSVATFVDAMNKTRPLKEGSSLGAISSDMPPRHRRWLNFHKLPWEPQYLIGGDEDPLVGEMHPDEWEHHIRIMADLRGASIDETTNRELIEIKDGTAIPQRLQQRRRELRGASQ